MQCLETMCRTQVGPQDSHSKCWDIRKPATEEKGARVGQYHMPKETTAPTCGYRVSVEVSGISHILGLQHGSASPLPVPSKPMKPLSPQYIANLTVLVPVGHGVLPLKDFLLHSAELLL